VETPAFAPNAHFFEIIYVEVVLPEEQKLTPETVDSTYWKVPLAADDLEEMLSDYEWAGRIDAQLWKEVHIHNEGGLFALVCNLVQDPKLTL